MKSPMPCHVAEFELQTSSHEEVIDITERVRAVVESSKARAGQCLVYTPHATAAVAVNENDDPNIGRDLLSALRKMVPPHDGWLHDRVDNNAAAHIKAALVGPSETLPVVEGRLVLGTWQNVFLCEFDGPRSRRKVVVSVVH